MTRARLKRENARVAVEREALGKKRLETIEMIEVTAFTLLSIYWVNRGVAETVIRYAIFSKMPPTGGSFQLTKIEF